MRKHAREEEVGGAAQQNQQRKRRQAGDDDGDDGDAPSDAHRARAPPPPPPLGACGTTKARHLMASCPACGNGAKPPNMMRHLRSCCPDHLATPQAAPLAAKADEEAAVASSAAEATAPAAAAAAVADAAASDGCCVPKALRALLEAVARQEADQRRRILRITFLVEEREVQQRQQQQQQQEEAQRQRDEPPATTTTTAAPPPTTTTTPTTTQRRPLPEVARLMALPERRAARLLDRAMRTIEMPRDPAPELRPLHECARFLAVAKPPGVPTTPAHRWRGGSMVNRLLWFGAQQKGDDGGAAPYEPRVLHRLDLDTSGVLLCAKDARAAAAGQAAMAGRGGGVLGRAEKWYVALAFGWPPSWAGQVQEEQHHEGDGDPAEPPTSPPPPGVRVVELGPGDPPGALLAFEVDAAIGRHPDSAVGRRVAADALPSWAAAVAAAAAGEEEREEEEQEQGKGRGCGKDGGGDDFLPASTRFVVLSAAGAAAPPASLETSPGETEPAPLACDASREATLATFGGGEDLGRPRRRRRRACLVLAALRTGRTHQIRLHLAHAALPIAGDELYGAALRPALPRQALHAWRLALECAVPPAEQTRKAARGGPRREGEAEGVAAAATATAAAVAAATASSSVAVRLDVRAPLPEDMLRAAEALGVPVPAAYRLLS